ncbi:nudix hydrolase [Holotrichia oblita]|uniref:Nudix hydrolase n=1 Tax=Holotrichia oblita TaxID=644536 RepID=A0ACB9TRH9_HOLOL|nr:nudix hydrolase [Holotrichia oblita]
MKPIRLQTQEPVKRAAILIPICVVDNRVSLMYVVQPSVLTDHKEKVNFPGDIKHEDDRTFADTALRASETLLGLDTSTVNVWGEGKLIVSRSDFSFIPVIGEITGSLNLNKMNMKADVEEIFTVPIQDLCNTKMNAYTQFKDEYSSPVFMGGKWRIWGFTAMVTNLFLKSLLATDGYAHPIQYVPSIKKGTTFPKTTRKH